MNEVILEAQLTVDVCASNLARLRGMARIEPSAEADAEVKKAERAYNRARKSYERLTGKVERLR